MSSLPSPTWPAKDPSLIERWITKQIKSKYNYAHRRLREGQMRFGGPYFSYEEIFDRVPSLEEVKSLLSNLDPIETPALLCQMNTDISAC